MKRRYYYLLLWLIFSTTIFSLLHVNNFATEADHAEFLRWTRLDTPGSVPGKNDIIKPSEVNRIAIGSDGRTFYAVDIPNANNATGGNALYKSIDGGISWSDETGKRLYRAMSPSEKTNFRIWNIAIAPNNTNFIAAVTNSSTSNLPLNVWLSNDGGNNWQNTSFTSTSSINTIDIATSSGIHVIGIGTRTGTGTGDVSIFKAPSYGGWISQGLPGDIMALKYSPNYANDATISIVYSNTGGTYLRAGIHDVTVNTTNWNIIYNRPLEITTEGAGTSPKAHQIISADLELPSNFSGQAPSFRRCYISIDASVHSAGIYRFDDNISYWLMPASNSKRISNIAYFGTYASGKLLAGEVLGNPCSATVMTWFTDAPTTCPVTCWYQATKPPTGATGTDNCTGSGYGNAQVAWSPDGLIGYAGTGSSAALLSGSAWPNPYLSGRSLDESSFSISRNNGQTWNQISLIDTGITRLTDIAPAPDVSAVYIASTNNNTNCSGFDSIWRSQSSPIGLVWERVLCKPTTSEPCASGQTNTAILRLAGDKSNGQSVFWTATGTRAIWWSADHGDWWERINPRFNVQDMAAEDSNKLFVLSTTGQVQQFTRNETGWLSSKTTSTGLDIGYSIATSYTGLTPDNHKGNIIIGGSGTGNADVAYSTDGGNTFNIITKQLPTRGNTMVVASSGYKSDGYILAINSGGMYAWGIFEGEASKWETWWGGTSFPSSVTGLSISRNYSFYFPTPASSWSSATPYIRWSAATAGLDPTISLGTEPTTRFRICGGLYSNDSITIYAIDQKDYNPPIGGVWCYVDCLAWQGPTPREPVSLNPVNFDPVSGRAGQINLKWNPQCLSKGYRIQLSNDIDFTALIADIGSSWSGPFYIPPNLDVPALILPPGGGRITDANGTIWTIPALQPNHTYYWRVMVKNVATGDNINSPWSWRESFTIKQGLRVTTPYYGLQLLSPDNGCGRDLNAPVCFSWTPLKDTTSYKLEISEKPDMRSPLVVASVPNTSYQIKDTLEPGTGYFWRVKAEKPYSGEWSAVFSFITNNENTTTSEPKILQTPLWVLVIMSTGTILAIAILILIIFC